MNVKVGDFDNLCHILTENAQLNDFSIQSYRFSLSWSRLMPDGRRANSNSAAKDYYHKLIDLLIENDIEPHVTLYHWDLPSALYTEKCPGKLFDYLFSHGQSQFHFYYIITNYRIKLS